MCEQSSYRDHKVFPFRANKVFEIVIDIERYHEFIPWCEMINILSRKEDKIRAEVKILFKGIRSSYISSIKFLPPTSDKMGRIEIMSTEGAFKNLYTLWEFYPQGESSKVTFYIEYTLRSRLVNFVLKPMYKTAQKKITEAFEKRCKTILGP